ELAKLLAWAIERCSDEVDEGFRFSASANHSYVSVEAEYTADHGVELLEIGICNKNPRGGGLGRQVEQLAKRAGEHKPVIVRSTDFPQSPRAEVVRQIGRLVAQGGRRVVVEDSDWRTMASMRIFRDQQTSTGGKLSIWLREERPLSRHKSLREILGIDELTAARRDVGVEKVTTTPEPRIPVERADDEESTPSLDGPLV